MSGFQYIWIDLLAVVKISQTSKIYKIYGKNQKNLKLKDDFQTQGMTDIPINMKHIDLEE